MPPFPPVVLSTLLLPILCSASPINRQVGISENVFMTTRNGTDGLEQRVCSIDSLTYMDGETIPTSSPCEHCVCRPPGFACTITSCEYRPGCKAFRRSDQCCPEYQCECEKDGKIYQNGEKIVDTNNPCEVCYCQGGEIICAVIDCYWRNDCAPRYIDNRCCPMYDHCPPPAAQGPIRHRLPTLTSPAPISWHNLTTSVAPSTSTLPPAPSTTTTPTTTSTTEVSTSATPLSETVSENISQGPSTDPAPPAVEVQAQSDDGASNNEGLVLPTTVQPELEASLADEQQPTVIPLSDDLHEENLVLEPSQHAQDEVNPTQTLSVPSVEGTNQSAVLQATSQLPSSSSASGPTIVAQPTQVAFVSAVPLSNEKPYEAVNDAVVTTSEPDSAIFQDDISTSSSITPALNEVKQDDSNVGVTEQPVQQFDPVEGGQVDPAAISNDAPIESHNDNVQPSTENVILNDDSAATTVIVPAVLQDETPANRNEAYSPDELVRHDLFEVSTQQSNDFGFQNDEEARVPVTTANVLKDAGEALVFADEVSNAGSTVGPLHDNVDVAPTEVPVSNNNGDLGVHDVVQDLPSVPTTTSNLLNDQAAEESATQQNDSLLPSGIAHDDDNAQEDEVHYDSAATEQTIVRDHGDAVVPVTDIIQRANDDDVTHPPQGLIHDDTDIPMNDGQSETVTEGIVGDNLRDVPEEVVTEKFSRDEGSTQNPSDSHVAADPVQVTEPTSQHDETAPTERIIQDDQADIVARATEPVPVSPDAADDVILADEPVTQSVVALDETSVVVTERIAADAPNTERVVHQADPTESETIQNDQAVPTSSPVAPPSNDQVFDIILDDEVIPSQPETLNQVRETVDEKQSISNSLLEDERKQDLVEPSAPAATASPQELFVREEAHNDEDNVVITTQSSVSTDFVNDEHAGNSLLNEQTEAPTASLNDEATTQRQFRDDIDEMLQLRHHINGLPHEDEEAGSTTVAPVQQAREEEIDVTTSRSKDIIVEDEPVVATTTPPENFQQAYKNKVQKVAEALQQFNVITGSEEVESKFRLEPEVFAGGSIEVRDNDVTTVQPEVLRQDGEALAQSVETTVRTSEVVLNDEEQLATEQPVHDGLNDQLGEASTVVSYLSDAVTDTPALIQNDALENDVVTNAPILNQPIADDATLEGSGSHQDEVVEERVATETSDRGRLDLETTVSPLNDENSASTVLPSSYSFRMDILSSVEDAVEGGSGNGEIQQDEVVVPTSLPPSFQDSVPESNFAPTTEQDIFVNDEVDVQTTKPESNIVHNDEVGAQTTKPETDVAQNDEASIITTEPSLSRFRTGLEDETEAPVQSSSSVASELQQNDFVEVSTGSPSGFAVEFRDNDEVATPTQAPIRVEEIAASHDEPVIMQQAPDIIPEEDESVTQANIPVLNLISSDHVTQAVAHEDEAVTQSAVQNEEEEPTANDEAVTQSIYQDSVVVPAVEPIVHDEVTVTQHTELIANDESATHSVSQDEPVAVTQSLNDDTVVIPTDVPHHDLVLGNGDQNTESPVHNDEQPVSNTESVQSVVSEDPVVFSDEPSPTVQSVDRLRADSIEQQTEQDALVVNDEATAPVNDDINVTTTNPILEATSNNNSATPPTKVVKKEPVLPETGLPRIQPISPDLSNPHELRFDFPMPPEKDHSWLSRAVNQFRRLAGFRSGEEAPAQVKARRARVPTRSFMLF